MSTERQFFGTDGVRGPYGGPLVNEAFFARLGAAAGAWVLAKETGVRRRETGSPAAPGAAMAGKRVLIGCDTRPSGRRLVQAVIAGLRVAGMEPVDLGVLPTPAVARAMKVDGAPLGVVITASHNPAGDNGIKFFKRGGLKLSDEEEVQIEALAVDVPGREKALAKAWENEKLLGPDRDTLVDQSAARQSYIEAMARLLPTRALRGWHIVLDTANGATCLTSLTVLCELGAEVVELGNKPDGANINLGCGSEHPEKMCVAVRAHGARLGVAHDGDGDRCVLCDEHGDVLDGDEILTLLALHALRAGRLAADTLVVTVQSNLGVDAAIAAAGGRVVRTPVGDRHVAERMRAEGATLGGESSGHIICADVSPTGDGLVAALRVMEVMLATGRSLSELRLGLRKFPSASTTVTVAPGAAKPPLDTLPALTEAIRALETEMGARGRVLARWSGTEPKLRLLVEGPTEVVVQAGLEKLAVAARADLGVREGN
jgi:phosphoglucosamine mutase